MEILKFWYHLRRICFNSVDNKDSFVTRRKQCCVLCIGVLPVVSSTKNGTSGWVLTTSFSISSINFTSWKCCCQAESLLVDSGWSSLLLWRWFKLSEIDSVWHVALDVGDLGVVGGDDEEEVSDVDSGDWLRPSLKYNLHHSSYSYPVVYIKIKITQFRI